MLQIITDSTKISSCQRQFQKLLTTSLKSKGTHSIGYPGGNFSNEIYSNGRIWASFSVSEDSSPRYLNAFGTELVEQGSNSIAVEINIPLSGINRRVSGLFAQDPITGDVFLLHRGRVGGGKKGIGKETFTGWYKGKRLEIHEGDDRIDTALLVTGLSDPSFLENLAFFVHEVALFKKSIPIIEKGEGPNSNIEGTIKALSYKPEFSGIKIGKRPRSFVAECNHGRIVDSLETILKQKHRSGTTSFFNNRSIDLGMTEDTKITAIFEIKTDTNTQNIYTGVGQLMFHAASDSSISKTLVLPRTAAKDRKWVRALERLGIALLEYEINGNKIEFLGRQGRAEHDVQPSRPDVEVEHHS